MNEIQELVKEGKLSKSLMEDKEFVDGAKKIFKSENIEMDDKKLAKVMDEIEAQLKKDSTVSDEELTNVSGGVTARGAITSATSVIGAATGAIVTSEIFPTSRIFKNYHEGYEYDEGYIRSYGGGSTEKKTNYGAVAGTVATGAGGGYVGYRLGKWICDKAGLK